MKKLFKKLETIMTASAFAEAGEHQTAREIIKEDKQREKRDSVRQSQSPRKQLRAS